MSERERKKKEREKEERGRQKEDRERLWGERIRKVKVYACAIINPGVAFE